MDVDTADQYVEEPNSPTETTAKADGKKRMVVPLDDTHPFDLDVYIAAYTGRTAVIRLLHIMQHCPPLATQAYNLASQRIFQLRDPSLHAAAVSLYNSTPGIQEQAQIDQAWTEEVQSKNLNDRNRLEGDLKTYQSNMIKESIRMAHRDLGNFYRSIGDDPAALKHHTKSREFCSTSQHVVEMCLNILELLIDQRNYAHITTYVYKADSAIDMTTPAAAAAGNNGASTSGTSTTAPQQLHKKAAPSAEREKLQTILDVASAIAFLGQASYEKAALTFLKLGNPKGLGDWNGKIITPGDIAIYGTLCALATLPRSTIKAQLLENETFGVYLEQEPYIRELVEAYLSSKFKTVLELLERYYTRHYLDVHLFIHVNELINLTRNRALILYFQPFAFIKLERMAAAFGLSLEDMEALVVRLIQAGEINGRVDSQNKILKAKSTDHRAELFARAVKAGTDMQAANRKLLLRMHLQQAELYVKAPKGHQGQTGPGEMLMSD
ncbi:hypothetical protein BD410DRAFT_894056 [Rickenella mellea]|uniref:PCI domain-containing protein n=1 Tax=Rickenella mellea TaxID=50990 RepID=A0A4Y7QL08_9AGAM|nr:hypothetical protein BD410DRAFT_894056 [Rickenella mellea]